ncbi:TonB-linked outer membrane protein, SusC/RagA family [Arenibacter palladensis]|uniref:TonB-linked outer membrane protein, SusC/RagA family n=1 Tax=Arenibacter palladensis TaxID=237373 RepID=A0A1M4XZ95_9FLAO|nr:SusC/RagA family TonB-linked outer membrane protein [Arenibacter palladensis]SHE98759.1 TonB-linked outer membrane protein, SusC/RagA family [Arenibacter palladensis]
MKIKNYFFSVFLMLSSMTILNAQNKVHTGKVVDQDSNPLPGVNVIVKGTSNGTQTDFDGNYSIDVATGQILIFTYLGQRPEEITVGSSLIIDVRMEEDAQALNEVVVVGLGQVKDPSKLAYSVSQVDTDQVLKANEADLINGLAGKSAGIQINNSSGLAGSSSRIVIRGVSSLNFGNEPLYIIDGVPISNTENDIDASDPDQALFYGSTAGGSIDIAPDQIKDITILKGAAASAIYGSRAANGVIVIQTKKGIKNSAPQVSFRSATTMSSIIAPEFQTEYAQGSDGVYFSGEPGRQTSLSWGPKISELDVPTYERFDIFRTGITYDNSVSVRGGMDKSSYFTSFSAYNQNGTLETSSFDRYSFLINATHNISEKFKLNAKMNYVNSFNERPFEGNGLSSIMWTVSGAPITYNLRPSVDGDGNQRLYRTNRNNPYFILDNSGSEYITNRFLPSLSLEYNVNDWISVKGTAGLDFSLNNGKVFENKGLLGTFSTGRLLLTDRKSRDFNGELIVTLDKDFSEKFTADYLLGANVFDTKDFTSFSQGSSFIIPSFYDLSNATALLTDEITTERRIVSYFGQANFGFNDFLFLTLTGRNDKSSTLPKKDNSFFYYSSSLGFDMAKAFDLRNWLDRAMLRGSYSRVGNDAPAYATTTNYIKANPSDGQHGNIDFPFRGVGSYVQSAVEGNPLLTPEFTNEFEISADLQFFKNRLGLEVSYYDRRSEDQIFNVPQAATTGFNAKFENAGSIQNKGIEATLSITPIQTKDFRWDVNVNYSKNESEVLKLAEGVESVRLAGFTNPGIFIRKGEPYGVIWTTLYKRNESGALLLDDNGYPIQGDVGNAGSVLPKWTGGATTSFEYKGLSLSMVMDVRIGGKIINLDENYNTYYGTSILTADREKDVVIKGIRESDGQPNTVAIKKDFTYWNQYAQLEEFVQKTDFIKLRNVTLAYNMPKKSLQKLGIGLSGARFGFSGRNLWIKKHDSFTGADPELSLYGSGNGQGLTNFQIPTNKSYSLTLNLTF